MHQVSNCAREEGKHGIFVSFISYSPTSTLPSSLTIVLIWWWLHSLAKLKRTHCSEPHHDKQLFSSEQCAEVSWSKTSVSGTEAQTSRSAQQSGQQHPPSPSVNSCVTCTVCESHFDLIWYLWTLELGSPRRQRTKLVVRLCSTHQWRGKRAHMLPTFYTKYLPKMLLTNLHISGMLEETGAPKGNLRKSQREQK